MYATIFGLQLYAMSKLNRTITRALEKAATTEKRLSVLAGYHSTSFSRFKQDVRDATPAAARALAGALRKRAELFNKLADQLEDAAREAEPEGSHGET